MATVTGFEGLRHPRKTDLKQFSELFEPLFSASSDEARRQAAAALSQCQHVPQSVALRIGEAPISIAAIFLTRSAAIDDATLLQIIRTQSPAHATAIARRENLSVHLVDALVERRQTAVAPEKAALPAPVAPAPQQRPTETAAEDMTTAKLLREEKLRSDLKSLARTSRQVPPAGQAPPAEPVIEPVHALHAALLVRFARSGEANLFAASLAAALSSSLELGERILLDISGQQLATALTAMEMPPADSLFILSALYPDLAERLGGATRGDALLAALTPQASRARVQSWLQAEQDDKAGTRTHQPYLAPDRSNDPRQSPQRQETARSAKDITQKPAYGRTH
ncbi:DUF2336 domain-containing protein [Pararhizobium polonicum]|nr:DUF2336 domain-containing protein [Pararhizobium polonicum]